MKRIVIYFLTLLIGGVFLVFALTVIKNNIILYKFSNQLYSIDLPPNSMVIFKDKTVGNLFGTGNHLDFKATIEINTELSETELDKYYSVFHFKNADEVSIFKLNKNYPDSGANQKHVTQLSIISKSHNIFIIQISDTHYATGLDIRGD
jgi:hypothetical protein